MNLATKSAKWGTIAKGHLVGRTIKNVFYLNEHDVEEMGWYQSGVVLVLDNNVQVLVQEDDEGNGPGSLLLISENESVILPTL
jgi:hypothetical protein